MVLDILAIQHNSFSPQTGDFVLEIRETEENGTSSCIMVMEKG